MTLEPSDFSLKSGKVYVKRLGEDQPMTEFNVTSQITELRRESDYYVRADPDRSANAARLAVHLQGLLSLAKAHTGE